MAAKLPTAEPGFLIPQEALARIPGYTAAGRVEQLSGGTVNRSFSVETREGRFFVRVHESAGIALGADHARESQLQEAAAQVGLAPRLVYSDPAHGFAISEFLAGRIWAPEDFQQATQLGRLGRTLRAVHELLPPIAAPFDLESLLNGFQDRIARDAPQEQPLVDALIERAGPKLLESGSALRSAQLFHSDPHHSNIIDLPDGRLVLVDWEYAAVGDPLFDLACVLAYYPDARPHARFLLESTGLEAKATPAMLEAARWLYVLLGFLWYRARRLNLPAQAADLAAEQALLRQLA